jgi:hypothetical protein
MEEHSLFQIGPDLAGRAHILPHWVRRQYTLNSLLVGRIYALIPLQPRQYRHELRVSTRGGPPVNVHMRRINLGKRLRESAYSEVEHAWAFLQ